METEKKNLDTILCEAVEITSEEERQAYLDRVCGDETALRSEAERLISDHFEAGDFLEKPVVVPDPTIDQHITEKPGTMLSEQVTQLLEHLGDEKLQELILGKMEGYTNAEMAQRLHCSERTIERRIQLIRAKFGQEFLE